MTTAPKRFRIGSATVVFAIGSCAWFVFVWSVLSPVAAKVPPASGGGVLRYALIATIPMLIVTAIACITVNVTQSEGVSWLVTGVAFVIGALMFVSWMGPYALSAA